MKMGSEYVIIEGFVSSGAGEGKKFSSLPWFKRQVNDILGFEPYPGTLNLTLTDDEGGSLRKLLLNDNLGYRIIPENNYFPGVLYRAIVALSLPGGVIIPLIPEYPSTLIEVISPICLRKILNLKDGDKVEVKIFFR
ncbi:MAG: CTP-dependent riboflavin kinase [Candidatus Bathyarchaeota archaeon]|nr:CTP-dependent riboflavin kinase [Candidatus Bathyarchaeota archaeon]